MSKTHKLKSINRTYGQIGNRKGSRAESRAFDSLSKYYREVPWIKFVRWSSCEEDLAGKDFVIGTDIGPLFLQIKSSKKNKEKFDQKKRRAEIQSVVIPSQYPDGVSEEEITLMNWEVLKKALNTLRGKILAIRGGM